jgi:Glycoside-hydrolase family GH114
MRTDRSRSARRLAALSALLATVLVPTLATDRAAAAPVTVSLPPAHAGFDYRIGGAYPPPAGVSVVSRDHDDAPATGLDFAVAEECGTYDECGDYTAAFDDHVIVIEYTAEGLKKACSGWGDELSVVRRDLDVSPAGSPKYERQTC